MPTIEVEDYVASKDAQIRVFTLTLIGVAFNTILALPAYQAVLLFMENTKITPEFAPLYAFLPLDVIVMLLYCWATSLAFQPKRIVNPLYIQIATAGTLTIVLSVATIHVYLTFETFIAFLIGSIATFVIALILLGIFGILQLFVVRWLVGLVGTINDLDRKTFLIDADFQTISGILLSDSFLHSWNLEKKKISAELLEIYTSYSAFWQIKLILGKSIDEPNKSILATTACEKRFYTIFNSPEVSDSRNDMIRRIESIIGKEKIRPTDFTNTPSSIALTSSLNVTKSKTIVRKAELGEVPSFYRNILILMGIITVVVSVLFGFGIIPLDFFATAIIMIIIALVIELAPRLREIMDAQKVG